MEAESPELSQDVFVLEEGCVDNMMAFCLMEKREAIDYIEILQVMKQKMSEFGTEEESWWCYQC